MKRWHNHPCIGPALLASAFLFCGAFLPWSFGGSVRSLDGTTFHGELRLNGKTLSVAPTEGAPVSIELKDLERATFAPEPFRLAGSLLANGWNLQDYGGARGMTRLEGDVFNMQVEGQSTNATAAHYAHQLVASDGDVVARIDEVMGDGGCVAGVMIRSTTSSSLFASLSLSADGRIRFHRRLGPDATSSRLTGGPTVTTPAWLRLQKRDRDVIASYSPDGKQWQRVGSDTTKWLLERTWREHQGELPLLRGSMGVFAASLGKNSSCTARLSQVSLTVDGLRGEYFAGMDFTDLRFARIDPGIQFDWKEGAPDPSLTRANFSVRWTGKFLPPKSDENRFVLEADGEATLWIDGQEVASVGRGKDAAPATGSMPLRMGTPVDAKLEFKAATNTARVKLSLLPGYQREAEIISMTNFVSQFSAINSPESIALLRATNDLPAVRGVWLRDGTFLAGSVARADVSAIRISFGGRKEVSILNSLVARVIFRPSRQVPFDIAEGRTGLFLRNGDFLEGDFERIEHGTVSVSSVLFGLKRFRTEGNDALAVVLNGMVPAKVMFRIRLLDGSSLGATQLSGGENDITIEEPLLGRVVLAMSEVFEIERVQPAPPRLR